MNAEILIVDDEADIRTLVKGILEDEGYKTRVASNSKDAYQEVKGKVPSLVVLDIWLQGSEHDGLEILRTLKKEHSHLPIVMISGHGTIETAVSAIKMGAYDFIEKPFKSDRLLLMIQRALETAELRRENEALKRGRDVPVEMVGESPAAQSLRQILERVGQTNSRVLFTGEPGTGKDVAARVLHRLSRRAEKPFMVLNCATLRPERLEIELFGSVEGVSEEGAQTGVLEQANGGTLLLDEVADMPLETQGKIVRVLQEQRFQKIGSDTMTEVDVRILASSNRDLEREIESGSFRQDLYYRLNVVPIHLEPLRKRTQDIPVLIEYFMQVLSRESGLLEQEFSPSALAALKSYSWPGNVRQLRNAIEWSLIMNSGNGKAGIDVDGLPPDISKTMGLPLSSDVNGQNFVQFMEVPLREARELFEREYLEMQVNRFDGNISKTAEFVGMERSALHRKLKSLQVSGQGKDMDSEQETRKTA